MENNKPLEKSGHSSETNVCVAMGRRAIFFKDEESRNITGTHERRVSFYTHDFYGQTHIKRPGRGSVIIAHQCYVLLRTIRATSVRQQEEPVRRYIRFHTNATRDLFVCCMSRSWQTYVMDYFVFYFSRDRLSAGKQSFFCFSFVYLNPCVNRESRGTTKGPIANSNKM